ncbi:hypothetical protein D9M69_724770 [compost metagenome]
MQLPDHQQGQGALAVEHLIDAVGTANGRDQVRHGQAGLLHAELDRIHRIGQVDRKVAGLVGLDQGEHHLEEVTFGSPGLRLIVEQRGHLLEGRTIILVSAYRAKCA